MAGINSRAKGARQERRIAKILGEYWGCKGTRVPLSGGWAKDRATGDVILDDQWPFSIEIKHYKTVDWLAVLSSDKCDLASFLQQAVNDAARMGKIPMLIARENAKKEFVFIPHESVRARWLETGVRNWAVYSLGGVQWMVFTLEAFLSVPKEVWLE